MTQENSEKLRIQKAYQVLNKTDIAVLVVDGTTGITPQDNAILTRIQDKKIPLLLVLNKADLVSEHVHQEMIVSTHLKYKIPLEKYSVDQYHRTSSYS